MKNSITYFIFSICLISFAVSFIALSLLGYWTHSEIYAAHISQNFFLKPENYLYSLKPIFYLLLFVSFSISEWLSLYPMTIARLLFAINGLLLLLFVFLFIKNKTDKKNALLASLVLMSSLLFLERGYRVRSDLLLSSLSIASLFLASTLSFSKGKTLKLIAILILLLSLPLISFKSIYWLFFVSCFLLYEFKTQNTLFKDLFNYKNNFLKYIIAVIATYLALLIGASIFFLNDPFFLKAIQNAWNFYLSHKHSHFLLTTFIYKDTLRSEYVNLLFKKDILIVLLFFLKIFLVVFSIFIYRLRKWNSSDTAFLLIICILFIHPLPKPFFIASIIPFIIISFFTDPLYLKLKSKYKPAFISQTIGIFLVYACIVCVVSFSTSFKKGGNFKQKEMFKKIDLFITDLPSVQVYDTLFLLYNRDIHHWHYESIYRSPKVFSQHLDANNIDLIFDSYNMNSFELSQWEKNNIKYIHGGHGFYYRSLLIDIKNKKRLSSSVVLQKLKKEIQSYVSYSHQRYWIVFLDQDKRVLNPSKNLGHCVVSQSLQEACAYTQNDFLNAPILIQNKQARFIAVSYIAPIKTVDKDWYLKSLYSYEPLFP